MYLGVYSLCVGKLHIIGFLPRPAGYDCDNALQHHGAPYELLTERLRFIHTSIYYVGIYNITLPQSFIYKYIWYSNSRHVQGAIQIKCEFLKELYKLSLLDTQLFNMTSVG